MRPVNLMPPEEARGGRRAPLRTGVASYVLLGGLALGLLLLIATALTSKQISDRESEKEQLTQELNEATARAQSLRSFADFRAMQETRTATVASLAQSRFDWERVMRELSLVIPEDVWLLDLTGSVSPAINIAEGAEVASRASVPGPALELVGCAPSQDSVAAFIAALEDIDGVTRVGFDSSEKADDAGGTAAAGEAPTGSADETSDDCRTREFITQFEIVVAFDAVPAPATATEAPGVPAPLAPGESAQPVSGSTGTDSTSEQVGQAQQATEVVPGG
jgi:Tfp pilus assembly protein PilN